MPPGNRLPQLVRQRKMFDEVRATAGVPAVAEQPLRREAFVAETDQDAWELFAPGLRHEYGVVYRSLHPTYPDDDTLDNLRRWGEDMFVVGSPATVAADLRRYADELGVTECLVRFQLPHVSHGAIRECLEGFRDVMALLSR
jgi:alkanesulfonate monooxygenase SsuD/methylene tetrahydromethanopterin reductase-like flavin-dependent oxidoreductase (luciferase family)